MSHQLENLLRKHAREQEKDRTCLPALDDILLFALERRYLDVGDFNEIVLAQKFDLDKPSREKRLQTEVRLFQIAELCFERDEKLHLPSVESIFSSFRDSNCSLLFLIKGEEDRVRVFVGLARFQTKGSLLINSAAEDYEYSWKGHFPGISLKPIKSDEVEKTLSDEIYNSHFSCALTGIPSLKRDENEGSFYQGLDRLIRSMRGTEYIWVSIADPISPDDTLSGIDTCHNLISDTHHLVKTTLTKSVSKSNSAFVGMFGMAGSGHTDSDGFTNQTSDSHVQNRLEPYQQVASGAAPVGTIVGMAIGTAILPGLGTAIGGVVGRLASGTVGGLINSSGAAITGQTGYSLGTTKSFAYTTSKALAHNMAGGGFGTVGMTWTRTSSITQEHLNRKAEYCEELLRKHEERLALGRSLGFWNLGHYFCCKNGATYNRGKNAIRSLYSGMESHFEPPRVIGLAQESLNIVSRFSNLYISFANQNLKKYVTEPKDGSILTSHPLGFAFNGMATPVNTDASRIFLDKA